MSDPCATPTPYETLVALWSGDLPAEDADAVEAHLFSCDSCSEACERLGQLVTGLRELIPPVISHAHRDRLVAAGTRIRHTPVQPGVDAEAGFAPDIDLLVHVLRGDLARAERVDVELMDPRTQVAHLQFQGVPFDPGAGEVLIACQRHFEHLPVMDPLFRVLAYEAGVPRRVGDYFVRHRWR